jgi:hypothetical protein
MVFFFYEKIGCYRTIFPYGKIGCYRTIFPYGKIEILFQLLFVSHV